MYAANSAPAINTTAVSSPLFPTITTYRLASQHPEFQFFASPRFVTQNQELSSDAKLLYGFYNSKAGQNGYLEKHTRKQIQAELGFSSERRLDRAQAELKKHGLIFSLQSGNGDPKIALLLPHSDMGLTEQELISRRIDLPPEIQRRIKRAQKLTPSALPPVAKLTPSALPPVAKPKEIKDTNKEEEKELALAEAQAISISNNDQIRMPETTSSTCPHCAEQPAPSSASISTSDIAGESASGSIEQKIEDPTTQRPERPQKTRTRKPKSKHSLELCRRFSQAEKERKEKNGGESTIEDVEEFAQACYWIGRHDKEIDRWLKKRAARAVEQTRTGQAPTKISPTQPNGQQESLAESTEAERAAQLAERERQEAIQAELLAQRKQYEAEERAAANVDPEVKKAVEEAARQVRREMQRQLDWKRPDGIYYARKVNERLAELQIQAPRLVVRDIVGEMLQNWT